MALQYTTIAESSFARGIDARSAENQIAAGFVRDLVNADIIEGRIRKRTGYASYAGNIPLRVIKFKQTDSSNQLCLTFDTGIDLSQLTSCPILVYGKSSTVLSGTGPFTTAGNTAKWYPLWTTTLRKTFLAGAGTISALADEHTITTSEMFVGLAESTNTTNLSSNDLLWGSNNTTVDLEINKTSFDITAGYTNNSGSNVNTFLYYAAKPAVLTETYVSSWTAAVGQQVLTVSAATHQLSSFNIIYQLWKDDTTHWSRVKPQEFTIDSSSGEVNVTVVNDTAGPVTYRLTLVTVPPGNNSDYNIVNGSNSITVAGITSPFIFYTLYVVSGTTLTEVIPDGYSYDADTKQWTLSFVNNVGTALTARVYYDYGSVRVNELCVTDDSITVDNVDSIPQLTVYGISHTIAYGENKNVDRQGWVNHIDSYRSPTDTHMVAGLGGNLFAALTASQLGSSNTLASTMNVYYPSLNARLLSATNIGPVFWDTGSAPSLTRGYITHDGGGTNWATINSATYQSNTGYTRYILSTPNLVKVGNPITVDQDYLTIKGMSHSKHAGTFEIKNVIYGTNSVTLDVENVNITNSDYDDSATSGLGGIFTDSIITATTSPFLLGDTLLSSFWGDEVELVVASTSGTKTTIAQVYDYLSLGAGLTLTGRRTSDTIPLRNLQNIPTVTNLVAGDTLVCSSFDYPLQVLSVDPINKTITIDEVITWEDNLTSPISFTVYQRWAPAESPTPDSGDLLLPKTTVRHLSSNPYGNQPFLRSAMVQNNMYLTNGDDEVYKYDGVSFYRAGIIPWQPGLFLTTQKKLSGGIDLLPTEAIPLASPYKIGNSLVVNKADSFKLTIGQVYKFTEGTTVQYLTLQNDVEDTSGGGGLHYLSFKEPLQFQTVTSAARLTLVYQARYSFRLNIKDKNGVTIASAVTGAEDFLVRLPPIDAGYGYTVQIRLVGLPAWDQYDYSNKNLELEIYRTLWTNVTEVPVFYKVATQALPFVGADGYIDFEDNLSNGSLTNGDPVVGVLSPSTVPAAWDEPARAKYVTSAGNRLVLANVTDWPTLAISYLTSGSVPYTSYNGQTFLFRRNSADIAADTNMVDRVKYELRSSGGVVTSAWSTSAGTSFTFTANVGRVLREGDWVYLYFNTLADATAATYGNTYSGWWQVASCTLVGVNTYQITIAHLGAKTPAPTTNLLYAMFASTAYDVPVNIDGDYNMGMVNGDTVNWLTPADRILRRIGMAINATMRMTNKSVHSQDAFIPWLTARSENDTGGQLIVKQPRAEVATPAVQITGGGTNYKTYINGSQSNGTAVTALTTRYPSRILVSYNNYPEIFDNPWAVDDSLSDSAIDINSSDGQEITGVIPFFGESAFGAALQSGVLVVFKQNSIYLVDLSEKALGKNAVQRIETQGLGCTAPYSIAPTKDGIAFANDSGIYRLRRDQRLEYLGRYMERNWKEKVDRSFLSIVQGHHYGVGRQYKLSVPLAADTANGYAENAEVYVYNHTNETADEPGGWARYTNHPATGWANLFQDAFFSTVNGSVKRVRALGEDSDYQDDNKAITVILETRAVSFDQPGIRKVVSHIVVNYRLGGTSESTKVETAPDLFTDFDETTQFKLVSKGEPNGLSSLSTQEIVSLRHSLDRRRCIYITVRITNNGKDESLEIAGMAFVVAGLNSKGIPQAATTKAQSGV